MSSILHLHLKHHWWDQIASGDKTTELRRVCEHWRRQIVGRTYDEIHLWRGYPPASAVEHLLRRRWRGASEQIITHPEFGASPVRVFAIDVSEPV